MSNLKSNKGNSSKYFRWTKLTEHIFFEILVEEAEKGNKPPNAFRSASISRVAKTIFERFQVHCDPEHVKNHLKTAYPKYSSFLNKKFDNYDEMVVVVGQDMTTRSFAKTFADVELDDEDCSMPFNFETENVEEEKTKFVSEKLGEITEALKKFHEDKTPHLYEEHRKIWLQKFTQG
ncbi:hypothetical protein HRI_004591100 [Hibiscus trionum]|uniref:Myb/SANT-like domain-containing protein n=1 Tax=Hibiscus trionum TaxID=183268 RepID=A0A9W7MNX1_HIBTR|nr:hypothetical protein HRI_004591100 [Hibiscus trionum]